MNDAGYLPSLITVVAASAAVGGAAGIRARTRTKDERSIRSLRWSGLLASTAAIGMAIAGIVISLTTAAGSPNAAVPAPLTLLSMVLVVAAAQLARVAVFVRGARYRVAWGEASFIVACAIVPVAWLPAVVLIGVALSRVIAWRRGDVVVHQIHAVAYLTIAATTAAVVANLAVTTYRTPLNWPVFGALSLGAVTYTVVAVALVAELVTRGNDRSFVRSLLHVTKSKSHMVAGNVAVGVLAVYFLQTNWPWLMVLAPAIWLLQHYHSARAATSEFQLAVNGSGHALSRTIRGAHITVQMASMLLPRRIRARFVEEHLGMLIDLPASSKPQIARFMRDVLISVPAVWSAELEPTVRSAPSEDPALRRRLVRQRSSP